LILVTRFTSKAPAFNNRRLGHPKFQVKGRATRHDFVNGKERKGLPR
jgi:hypothetical protein